MPKPQKKRDPLSVRTRAAELSTKAGEAKQVPNKEEVSPFPFNFRKGLPHDDNGLLSDPTSFVAFALGTEVHDPRPFGGVVPYRDGFPGANVDGIEELNLYRRWESPTAGHAFVLEGPDPFAVTMPPAPAVGSAEFAAEMAEVYQMALFRDLPVAAFMDASLIEGLEATGAQEFSPEMCAALLGENEVVEAAGERLSSMAWFSGEKDDGQSELIKHRRRNKDRQSARNLFRGLGEDDWATPFLSQFMVMGSGGTDPDRNKVFANRATGQITYGAQRIPQDVRVARPRQDYMTGWQDWLNVQNALDARRVLRDNGENEESEFLEGVFRPMARLRDLATYVHDDQLYQAYLNAALLMLSDGFAVDPGIPYHGNATEKFPFPGAAEGDTNRTPFALFGGPHLLTLVTEVSSRALKAVRLQKFTVHRRMRPEGAGAMFHTVKSGYHPHRDISDTAYSSDTETDEGKVRETLSTLLEPSLEPALEEILEEVMNHNATQNGGALQDSYLLPMAFPEGSPMHPAYGAGHATVAGACVTLLKAFFDMGSKEDPVYVVKEGEKALVPHPGPDVFSANTGLLGVKIPKGLTLESELNKLMWNISNGRNVGGVHYYTDYVESALLGEAITIGILREQMLAYHPQEHVTMTVPLLTKRKLPAALLTGQTALTDKQEVEVVTIHSDGTLSGA